MPTRLSRREVMGAALAAPLVVRAAAREVAVRELDLGELARVLAAGECTSVDLVRAYAARVRQLDGELHSVLELNPDAERLAAALDEERRAGRVRGPLHGVPVLVKDNLDTADQQKTTAGSLALLDAPTPARDAFVVRRLREAGAVVLGKTNLSEWANLRGKASVSGWSARGGQVRNPYELSRNPSGSSSGSAVAVAASLCAAAIGTETDGSIVSPACSCGIVGLKPTVGLVSRAGIIPISHTQDTAGPMTRSVRDAALVLDAIAGVDPLDPMTRAAPTGRYAQALEGATLAGARLGVWRALVSRHRGVEPVMGEALRQLRDAGATLVDVELSTAAYDAAELEVLLFEQRAGLDAYLSARGGPLKSLADVIAFNDAHAADELAHFGQELFLASQARGPLTSPAYRKALAACGAARRDLEALLSKHRLDAIVAPTGTPAWVTDPVDGDNVGFSCSTLPAVAGTPHLAVPMGFVGALPVTLSFLGRAWSEPRLLALGHAFEQRTRARRPPPLG